MLFVYPFPFSITLLYQSLYLFLPLTLPQDARTLAAWGLDIPRKLAAVATWSAPGSWDLMGSLTIDPHSLADRLARAKGRAGAVDRVRGPGGHVLFFLSDPP